MYGLYFFTLELLKKAQIVPHLTQQNGIPAPFQS